ncbi:MurR/RpiR family transcriptional regulator [Desemzia sp. RIT804]|uniref:MurR/RpiR family transcriptional regulator n=1 Tax=Desemzia sp. RIT 804 TaxID=2810209 RepID=UPI00194E84B4|nr:MurR/RpiR family transcriptional regulator [Desemzia sp. RIT 804]MBM6615912.1 MurR/RpiR family transcriptional regulator [Desemzia sp. RIT 804]
MLNNILLNIKEKKDSLPLSEKKIAELILQEPASIINMNSSLLAQKAGSSSAAVIRFCHSIGLKGFVELKLQLSADLQGINDNLYTDILPGEELGKIKKKLLVNTNHVFKETNNTLADEVVTKATKLFYNSSVIYPFGLGASNIVAEDFQQKFSRIGKKVIFIQDQHVLATSLAVSDKNALFLGISNGGEKGEVLALTKMAKSFGLKTVSLTRNTDNTLSRESDIALKTAFAQEPPLRSGATISLLTQMYAIDILFYAYVTNYYESSLENLEKSKEAINHLYQQYDF